MTDLTIVEPTDDEPLAKIFEPDFSCSHPGPWKFHKSLAKLTCKRCNAELSPLWAIGEMARHESSQRWRYDELRKRVEATKEKMRCKCEHCGQMTRIERGRQ